MADSEHRSSQEKIPVLAAVIERQNRFLVCQRPSHKRHGGLWEFPGGKIEPEETLLEAAGRELIEELNLYVMQVGQLRLSVGEPQSNFLINFVDVHAEGEPVLLEHSACAWLSAKELLDLPLAPADRLFAEYLNIGENNHKGLAGLSGNRPGIACMQGKAATMADICNLQGGK